MANPSYTHSLTNGTTADASQVMQNFNDILNGVTDSTKDLSINAFTVNLNGNTTLGNSSADDLTFTGSLASSIPVKTTASFDIGSSTLGLQSIYFGRNSQTVRIIGSSSMSATWTLTLPVDDGTTDQWFVTNGSGTSSWTNTVTTGKTIDGSADEIQLKVQAHSSQTANVLEVEKSTADNLLTVSPKGIITAGDTTGITGSRVGHTLSMPGNSGNGNTIIDVPTALATTEFSQVIIADAGSGKMRAGVYKNGSSASNGFLGFVLQDSTTQYMWIGTDTKVRISDTSTNIGSTSGNVVGDQTSDERLKSHIKDYKDGLNAVLKLRPVRYELRGQEEIGFIAQETQKVVPEAVYDTGGEEHYLAMQYVRLIPAVVNAIHELDEKLEKLEKHKAS
jgi:hypothetical protein